ncbi:hypothetical protein HUT18_00010 [Streptomyces sp. NA04227]|uniref:hypothetical protein n=1 Tax=Streptomyces sp. NA04227 TaxID=2742136 RepID=UPI0015915D0B|nr:hypothetical protein [Streptomyces sp. NA04227]QKW04978.1 hypothetical protein HUT18_00010 [Streptomyces sp. NA04227]
MVPAGVGRVSGAGAFLDDWDPGAVLNAFSGCIDLCSGGGHTHTDLVRLQVWHGQPEPDRSEKWDEQAESEFVSSTGEVAIWTMALGRADENITLAAGGGRWGAR